MRRKETQAFVADWIEAWKRRDVATLAASHSEKCIYNSSLAGTIQGREAVRSLYDSWFQAFPDMVFKVEVTVIDGALVAMFWSQRGRHMGDFCGLAGTGRSFELPGVFLMTLKDGQIISNRSVYDFTGLLLQIGILKAKPAV